MSQARSTKHTVPTHMNVPDKVLTIGSLSLSARQFLILLIGSSIGYNLWHQLHALSLYIHPLGVALRLCLALLPALLALIFALAQVAGRPLEVWCFVLLRYCWQPKRVVWCSVRCELSELREGRERQHEAQLEPDFADVPGEAEAEAGHAEACKRASEKVRN